MKKYSFYLLMLLVCTVSMVSCSDDDDDKTENYVDLIVESSSISVSEGATSEIAITKGNGEYTATSDNTGIATVAVTDGKIKITGVKVGDTTVKVRDKGNKEATIAVTVISKYEDEMKDVTPRITWATLSFDAEKGDPALSYLQNGVIKVSLMAENGDMIEMSYKGDSMGEKTVGEKEPVQFIGYYNNVADYYQEENFSKLEVIKVIHPNGNNAGTIWYVLNLAGNEAIIVCNFF